MRRISCTDLALNVACDRIFEAETDDDVLEQARVHARDDHDEPDADAEPWRQLVKSAR